jgi:hypothetical protein
MPTFLGAPYVIVPFERGRELLAMDPSSTSYLIGSFNGAPRDLAREGARAAQAFPDVALVSARDFQASSSLYWQKKTGAGLAVLIAAVLAGLLMAILLANGLQRFIQRYHQDFVSLLGHGADGRDVSVIVGGIGMIIALSTMVAAMVVTPVIIALFKPLLPWAQFNLVDALVPLAAILVSLIAGRGWRKPGRAMPMPSAPPRHRNWSSKARAAKRLLLLPPPSVQPKPSHSISNSGWIRPVL